MLPFELLTRRTCNEPDQPVVYRCDWRQGFFGFRAFLTLLFSISIGEVMNRNRVRHQDVHRFDSIKAVSANHLDASKAFERPQVTGANLRRKPPVRFFPRRASEINGTAKLV